MAVNSLFLLRKLVLKSAQYTKSTSVKYRKISNNLTSGVVTSMHPRLPFGLLKIPFLCKTNPKLYLVG